MAGSTICDNCAFYDYNEDYECYECTVNLDEDEMFSFINGTVKNCPYFHDNDDYKIVRKQN